MALIRNLRSILRGISQNPGFSAAFVLTLGLGIGANTAIFSVVNGVLLRPLPYPGAERIMHLRQPVEVVGTEANFSFAEIEDYRLQAKTVDEFVEFGDWVFNVLERGEPHRAIGGLVTPNFFSVLGMQPLLGRTLTVEDADKAAEPVAVLTYDYWVRVLGADPAVLDQTLDLTVKKARIVGVLKPGAHYAASRKQDFYANYAANDHYMGAAMQDERSHRMTDLYARLAEGATVEQARQEIQAINRRLQQEYPKAYPASQGFTIVVTPWKDELTRRARPSLLILLGTAGFVLLIACANVANLTLTRGLGRERDLAIRASLGAGRGHLRRLLLGENLILSIAGAGLGLVVAAATLDLLVSYTSRFTLRTGEIDIDGAVLGFTVFVAVGAALFFAWIPGLRLAENPAPALAASGNGRTTGSTSRRRLQKSLVIAQLGLSFMLLVGAGLLLRSLIKLHEIDPGFDLDNVLTMDAPDFSRRSQEQRREFTRSLLEEVSAQGGIQSAAMASDAPFGDSSAFLRQFRVEGREGEPSESFPLSVFESVSSGYFQTIGTPLLRGRAFASTDTPQSPPVAIINQTMADYYFAGQDPLGRRLSWRFGEGKWSDWLTIVGIAANNRSEGLEEGFVHTLYVPEAQSFAPSTVLVRTSGNQEAVLRQVVSAVRGLDSNRPVDNIRTLQEARLDSIAPQRLNTTLFGIFALLALAISAVGVGGVLAFSVRRRTHEIGIRMALGADRRQVLRMVLREGLKLTLAGLVLGGIGGLVLSRLLNELLFEVEPIDLPTFAGVAVVLVVVAATASLLPARKASRVDPMEALRVQ